MTQLGRSSCCTHNNINLSIPSLEAEPLHPPGAHGLLTWNAMSLDCDAWTTTNSSHARPTATLSLQRRVQSQRDTRRFSTLFPESTRCRRIFSQASLPHCSSQMGGVASLGFSDELWEIVERCWLEDHNARLSVDGTLSCSNDTLVCESVLICDFH